VERRAERDETNKPMETQKKKKKKKKKRRQQTRQ
jgi:hypothetical protein